MLFEQPVDVLVVDLGGQTVIHHDGVELEEAEQGLHARVHARLAFHTSAVEHGELFVEQQGEAAGVIRVREHILGFGEQFDEVLWAGDVGLGVAEVNQPANTAAVNPRIFLNSVLLSLARPAEEVRQNVFVALSHEATHDCPPLVSSQHECRI